MPRPTKELAIPWRWRVKVQARDGAVDAQPIVLIKIIRKDRFRKNTTALETAASKRIGKANLDRLTANFT
jgi:hypothetical protein